VSADLENALGEALLTGGRMPRHARGFRMKHGRAQTDHGGGHQHHRVIAGVREPEQSSERRCHADDHGIGPWFFVRHETEHRLQQ
jgi:hypothetical protein